MFGVILPSHVPGLLCQAHQTPCLLFRVTSPSSAGPALLSLSARCFRLLRGLLMFVHTAETHLSAKTQSVQLAFLSGLETWQMGPAWVGFYCSQLRHNLGCLAICTLPQGCGAGDTALAGVSQAMAKSAVCKMLVMPGTNSSMADGQAAWESLWLYLQQMTCGLNQDELLAWAFQSTVVFRQEPVNLSSRDLICHLLHSAVSRGFLVCCPRNTADQRGLCCALKVRAAQKLS